MEPDFAKYSRKSPEEERVQEALDNYDARKYYILSNDYGLPVENKELYEQGKAEIIFGIQIKVKSLKESIGSIADAPILNNPAQADRKREWLMKYYTSNFGRDGKQDLIKGDYRGAEIGKIFRKVVESDQKKLKGLEKRIEELISS